MFYVSHCVSLFFNFFRPFSSAITSLGEERAYLSAFRTFVRFALVWFCLFPLPLGVWEELRFVIVALPGLLAFFISTSVYKNWRSLGLPILMQVGFGEVMSSLDIG